VRHAPYGNSLARTSLELALSSATFDQQVALLFLGDGVLQLLPQQDSSAIGVRNIARLIASFPLYELTTLFADQVALTRHGLSTDDLAQGLEILDDRAMRDIFNRYDHILSF
jgi:tRNA 2-thiouridine synthesizing protein C